MAQTISKAAFLHDLRSRIAAHQSTVQADFQPLPASQLARPPHTKEWSILQCFDHLNQTHRYYMDKIALVLSLPAPEATGSDHYRASFWGGIYMAFAFNPRFSFPTPEPLVPAGAAALQPDVLDAYLVKQRELLHLLDQVEDIDLCATRIPVEKGLKFNLGDCLKILVYHDALHIRQAHGVRDQLAARAAGS
jgi:hypothetical protein